MGAADLPNPDEKTVNAGKLTNCLYCHVLMLLLLWFGLKGLLMFELYSTGMKTQQLEEEEEMFICHIHSYTEYNPAVKWRYAFNPSKSTHTWSSGHTHTHTRGAVDTKTHTPGAVDTYTPGAVDTTHTQTHTPGAVGTHTDTHTWSSGHTHTHTWSSGHTHTQTHTWSSGHTHTHLEQWAVNAAAPGEQLGVRCLAQGSHLSRGQFLPEPRTHNLRLQVQRSIH